MLHSSFEILKTRSIGKNNTTYQAMKLTDVEDDSKKNIRTTAHVEEMAAAMLVTLFLSPPKEKESFFVDDCCIYTKHEGQIFTIQKWHFDLTRLGTVEIIWIEDIGLFSRRVVEGLNVITVLNVITFGPKCNKPLMQSFNSVRAVVVVADIYSEMFMWQLLH